MRNVVTTARLVALSTLMAALTGTPARAIQGAAASDPPPVRGLYVNRFAAQSAKKMRSLIALADTTEITAFVIDIKDEFGINYQSRDALVERNAGRAGWIPEVPALIDTLH